MLASLARPLIVRTCVFGWIGWIGLFLSLPAHADDNAEKPPIETKEGEAKTPAAKAKPAAKATPKAKPKLKLSLLPLKGAYADHPQPASLDPTALLLGDGGIQKSFYKLCDYLDQLAEKDSGQWVVLDLSAGSFSLNGAQMEEFVRRFKKVNRNKRTVAWIENATTGQLAVAAQCDTVIMADFGGIDMPSASMETMFYKDAMDMLGIKASVVRAGDFKGAVEPYTNPQMSDHLRQHYLRMLKSINDTRVAQIANGRGITKETVRKLQSQRLVTPKEALEAGLVDRLAPYGSMKETINALAKRETEWAMPKRKPKKQMSFFELMGQIMAGPKKATGKASKPSIAVLHLSGAITDGNSSAGMSSIRTVKRIKALIDDDNVKAVVVRINSPGGSATASEAIRQQLVKLAAAKPVVISMGRVAASGGYWISCIDRPIYAENSTITGSIGVFSMKLSMGALLRRLGVHVESITLDESASAFAIDRPFTAAETESFGKNVAEVYDRFLGLVSKSRKMKVDEVDAIAGGRVWSGTQAKAIGLVDELGGIDHCIERLAKDAKMKEYEVIHRPLADDSFNLMSILQDSNEDEIFELLPKSAIRALQLRGFDLSTTRMLINDSLGSGSNGARAPKTWLMHPSEIRIK